MRFNTSKQGEIKLKNSWKSIFPEEEFPGQWSKLYEELEHLAESGDEVENLSNGPLSEGIAEHEFKRGVALFTNYLVTELSKGSVRHFELQFQGNLIEEILESCINESSSTDGVEYDSSKFNSLKEDIPFMREALGEDYPIVRFNRGFPPGVDLSVSKESDDDHKTLSFDFLNSELNKLINEAREALPVQMRIVKIVYLNDQADTYSQLRHQMGGFLAATTLFLEVSELTWKEVKNHEQELEKEVGRQETVLDHFERELDGQGTVTLIEALEDVDEELVQMAEALGNEAFIDGLGEGIQDFDEGFEKFIENNTDLSRGLKDNPDLSDGFIDNLRQKLSEESYTSLYRSLRENLQGELEDLGEAGFQRLSQHLKNSYREFNDEDDWEKLGYTVALYSAIDILQQAAERSSKNQDVSDSQVEKKKERQRKLLKREIGRIDRQATGYFYDQHIFLYFRYAKILYRFTDRLSDDYVEIQAGAQKGLEKFLEPYAPNSHMHHANIKPDSKSDKAFRRGMEIAGLEKEDMPAKVEPEMTPEALWRVAKMSKEIRQNIQDNADFRDSTILEPITGVFERIEEEREGKGKRFRRGLTAAQYAALMCREMYKGWYGEVIQAFRDSDSTV